MNKQAKRFHPLQALRNLLLLGVLSGSIPFSLRAQEQTLLDFCLQPAPSLSELEATLAPILVKEDRILPLADPACVQILTAPIRRELFEKFLSRRYTLSHSATGPDLTREQCHIEILKKGDSQEQQRDVGANPWSKQVVLEQREQRGDGEVTSFLLVQNRHKGLLSMDEEQLEVTCEKGLSGHYTLTVALAQTPKPQYHPQQGPIQAPPSSQLQTTVTVRPGELLPLGEIITQEENKKEKLAITGVDWQKAKSEKRKKFFLRIKEGRGN